METKITLWQIDAEHQRLMNELELNGGELTPELEEALAISEQNFDAKAQNYSRAIQYYGATSDQIAAEIKRLQALKKTTDNIESNLKSRLAQAMQTFEREKIDFGTMKLGLRRSKACIIDDEALIPAQFVAVKTEVRKSDVKAAIEAGEDVPGAHVETNVSLSIR